MRGDGGYIVAPPSVHPNGRPYEWDVGLEEAAIAPLPAWLIPPAQGEQGPRPASHWRALMAGVGEGQRNDATARLCGHLLGRGVDPSVTLELLVCWDAQANRPPLGREEVTRTAESIARRELAKRRGPARVGA